GLYLALLVKKHAPKSDITVFERNKAGVTWGWGIVFSDETLENFQQADAETYKAISASFARWESIDIHFRGKQIRSSGHHFYGIRRTQMLRILQDRCAQLGVQLQFEKEISDPSAFSASDLIVAADGVNSAIRTKFASFFQPEIVTGKNKYIW